MKERKLFLAQNFGLPFFFFGIYFAPFPALFSFFYISKQAYGLDKQIPKI